MCNNTNNALIAQAINPNASNANTSAKMQEFGVLIIYGNGKELGDFGQFANDLKKRIANEKKYKPENIVVQSIQNKNVFFSYLMSFDKFIIAELHIFSHASGGGVYLGYGNQESGNSRNTVYRDSVISGIPVTYEEVVEAELGAVLTDDFLKIASIVMQPFLMQKFKKDGLIKLWGCNAGIEGWVYSDSPGTYYWEALNAKNTPKPAVAKAFATYFNIKTYGAKSGSHIEFNVNGKWQIMSRQPARHNGIRLHPDKGDYYLYTP